MMHSTLLLTSILSLCLYLHPHLATAVQPSTSGSSSVVVSNPSTFTPPNGTTHVASSANGWVTITGIRGVFPNSSVPNPRPVPQVAPGSGSSSPALPSGVAQSQIQLAFSNLRDVITELGGGLNDCTRLGVYLTDLNAYGSLVDVAERSFWTNATYPPRTLVQVANLQSAEAVVELEGTFYIGNS